MSQDSLARAHLAARNFGFAEAPARQAVEKQPNQFVPAGHARRGPPRQQQGRRGQGGLPQARADGPPGRQGHPDRPPAGRDRRGLEGRRPVDARRPSRRPTRPSPPPGSTSNRSARWPGPPPRPSRSRWPTPTGKPLNLADHKGRNVVVLFYLGGKCAHCMQQLQEFGKQIKAFEAIGTDLVAIGTDDLEDAKALKTNADGIKFPMPFLPDPSLDVFKKYQAFDDFEDQPAPRRLPDRQAGQRPVPADLRRPVPRRRVPQGRGGADQPDGQVITGPAVEATRAGGRRESPRTAGSARMGSGRPSTRPTPRPGPDLSMETTARPTRPGLDLETAPGRGPDRRLRPLAGKPAGSLVIHEIYRSLQGESTHAGLPCTFVRLTACHLRCTYCDTPHAFHSGETADGRGGRRPGPGHRRPPDRGDRRRAPAPARGLAAHDPPGRRRPDRPAGDQRGGRHLGRSTPGSRSSSTSRRPARARPRPTSTPTSAGSSRSTRSNTSSADRDDFDWSVAHVREHDLAARVAVLIAAAHGRVDPTDLAAWILETGLPLRLQVQLHKLLWDPTARGV